MCNSTIGNFVWHDLDCDGIQDVGEPGIQGVVVILKDGQGTQIAQQTTGVDGSYLFQNLCAGSYTVCVDESTLPPNFAASLCDVGGDDTIDNDCSPANVLVPDGQTSDDSIDFGYCALCVGTIGDFVWEDLDGNNLQDAGEPGIPGVVIVLKDDQQIVLAMTTTDANGFYDFTGLCPGTYKVEYDPDTVPLNLAPVLCDFGIDDTVDSDCSPACVVLTDNDPDDSTVDFGFGQCAPCSGGLTSLTLQYQGSATAFIVVKKTATSTGLDVFFSGSVDPLEAFSFFGTAADGKFPKDIKVFVDGVENTTIHTSCSQPVGPGAIWGDFQVVTGTSLNGGPICTCGPCDGGLTSLTLASLLPIASFVEVKKDAMSTGSDIFFQGVVSPLEEFTFVGNGVANKFPKDIRVFVDGTEDVKIHTSCSQPVDPGTQVGSFLIVAGSNKKNGPICDPGGDPPTGGVCGAGSMQKVIAIIVQYTGDDETVISTQQPADKFGVEDFNGGPAFAAAVFIVARNNSGTKIWFSGPVALGDTYTIDSAAAGATKLDAATFVDVFDASGTVLLQQIEFHTSCSQPLAEQDQYGSALLQTLILTP